MKKSLSLVVTGALVTSVFASSAFAAELTPQQKFDALKAAGIVEGYPDGTAGLEKNITRAEVSKVVALLEGLGQDAASSNYKDVSATYWAKGYIGAVTKAGIFNGLGNSLFGPTQNVTVEQIAKILVEASGLTPKADASVSGAVSAWAKGYVAAAIEAGLIGQQASYKVAATRGQVIGAAYDISNVAVSVKSAVAVDEKNIEVTFSDGQVVKQALTTALVAGQATKVDVTYNGKTYSVEVTLAAVTATDAKQTGAKKISVNFSRALTATEQTYLASSFTLKNSVTPYTVTTTFSDDKKSAILTAAYLPAGEYTVSVKNGADLKVTVVAEAASKLTIDAPALSKAKNQELDVNLWNQFGEEITTSQPVITVTNTNTGTNISPSIVGTKQTVDLSGATVGDNVVVTAFYASTGLSATKTYKVINGSAATVITLGDVAPLDGDTRVSVSNEGYVLPVTLKDASGTALKLPETTTTNVYKLAENTYQVGGLVIYVSNGNSISNLSVNSDGNFVFNTTETANTVTFVVTNPGTGVSASKAVVVNGTATVKTLNISHPGIQIVQGEEVVVPFTAIDTYGNAIAGKDLDLSSVSFVGGLPMDKPYINAKGELVFKFNGSGSTTVTTFVGGVLQTSTLSVTVLAPSTPIAINGIKDVNTTFEVGAKDDFDTENITFVDNYGRVNNVGESVYTVSSSNTAVVNYVNGQLVAGGTAGSATITVSYNGVANSSYQFTVNVIASTSIKSYAISSTGTIYGGTDTDVLKTHQVGVTLTGKTSSGTTVQLVDSAASFVTTSAPGIVKTVNGNKVQGVAAGKATLTAFLNGSEVATQEVTVSADAPIAKTVAFDADEYAVAVGKTVTPTLTITDQYGFDFSGVHYLYSSDTTVATVSSNGVVTGVKKGSAVITYKTENGVTATTTVVVN
jgi:hypothetical protein